jgi:hypothetical protein
VSEVPPEELLGDPSGPIIWWLQSRLDLWREAPAQGSDRLGCVPPPRFRAVTRMRLAATISNEGSSSSCFCSWWIASWWASSVLYRRSAFSASLPAGGRDLGCPAAGYGVEVTHSLPYTKEGPPMMGRVVLPQPLRSRGRLLVQSSPARSAPLL